VVARPAPHCPSDQDCKENEAIASFAADATNDGVISFDEFTEARAKGNVSEIAKAEQKYLTRPAARQPDVLAYLPRGLGF